MYNRPKFSEDDFRDLVGPMFQDGTILLLKQLYQWLVVDPTDIDEAKYLLLKKFSEVLNPLSETVSPIDYEVDDFQYWKTVRRKTFIRTRREQFEGLL